MHEHINTYLNQGFIEQPTDSGTGSYILVNQSHERVVKFSQDPAYDKFIEFALKHQMPALPVIFNHQKPLGNFKPLSNIEYTVTELEILSPLSSSESQSVLAWIDRAFSSLRTEGLSFSMLDDPHNLKTAFDDLRKEAIRVGVSLDVLKGTNFMMRKIGAHSCYVITDPFN